jgi:hypothetical protein
MKSLMTSFEELSGLQLKFKNGENILQETKPIGISEIPTEVQHHRTKGSRPFDVPSRTSENLGKMSRSISGPELKLLGSVGEAVATLRTMIDAVYTSRKLPHMVALADCAIQTASGAVLQKDPSTPASKVPLKGLELLIREGIPARMVETGYTATRCHKLVQIIDAMPAYTKTGYATITGDGSEVAYSTNHRSASSALDFFVAFHPGLDLTILHALEMAKVTPAKSLRDKWLVAIRRALPDFGAALVLSVLNSLGFSDGSDGKGVTGMPVIDLIHTNFVVLTWAENVMSDLRTVLAEKDKGIRGECYSMLATGPDGKHYDTESYAELFATCSSINIREIMTPSARRAATELFYSRRDYYNEKVKEYRALQSSIGHLQESAILACDMVLALIRHKKEDKRWRRDMEAVTRTGLAAEVPSSAQSRIFGRKLQRATPDLISPMTPLESTTQAMEGGFDSSAINMRVPRFDAAALGLSVVERRRALEAVGVDGGRICEAYPGIVWEAFLGPICHALDLAEEELDLRMVVIAPRRGTPGNGGLGVDVAHSRMILLSEYEDYFQPVERS